MLGGFAYRDESKVDIAMTYYTKTFKTFLYHIFFL